MKRLSYKKLFLEAQAKNIILEADIDLYRMALAILFVSLIAALVF